MVAHQEAHERANNFWRVALAETFKFFSLRSQRASFAVLIFLPPLVAGIRSWISPAQNHLATSKTIWALDTMAMTALPMGFLAAAVGLTVMASEYQNGALISTRLAEPSLRKLIWAKGIVAFFTAGLALPFQV